MSEKVIPIKRDIAKLDELDSCIHDADTIAELIFDATEGATSHAAFMIDERLQRAKELIKALA